jgi:hypothetical protein
MSSMFETLTDWVDGALTDPNSLLAPLTGTGDVETALDTLHQRADDLDASADIGDWVGDAANWFDALDDVADAAFAAPKPLDQLIARVIQSRIPRLGAALALLGVIVSTPDGGQRIDWDRLGGLASSPDQIVDEAFWDDLLAGFGQPGDGRRIAVLIALILLAPQTILALERGDLSVAPLPAPATRSGGAWQAFRNRTQDWLSVTFPIADPTKPTPNPRSVFDWVSGIQPDLGVTAAGRATRVAAGAGHRTDFELWLAIGIEGDLWELDLGNDWILKVEPGVTGGFGKVGGTWHGGFRQFLVDSSRLPGPADPVELTVRRDPPEGVEDVLLGPPYDTRLEIRDLFAFLRLREQSPIAELGFEVKGLALVVTNRWFRTFGVTDATFREGLRYDADVALSWAEGVGFRLGLSSAFEVLIVIPGNKGRKAFGPIALQLHDIRVRIPIDAAGGEARTRIEIRLHASIEVSTYVVATVDGAGVWVGFGFTWKENLGDPNSPRQVFGLLPPTGAGIVISIGPITGGGYVERKELPSGAERWGGVLQLGFQTFSLVALGIWERQTTGDTSFIVVIGVRFSPGIQIGYGFAITGFGGLLGIDRRADGDALRERLTSGAAGNVLFPDDPIRNAPIIIGDLGALFPAREGVVVAGPTAQLSWLSSGGTSFARLDIGIVLEFTGPALTKVILMGSLRGGIPGKDKDKPLLQLRIDIIGILDLQKRTLEFDASLIDSKALDVFHITGDAAFRLSWGDEPYVLLSIGGFHPEFDPKDVIVPDLTRVALTLNPGFLDVGMFVRAEAYLAITTNSFQLGTRMEVGVALGPLNVIGFIAFDALVEFSPFRFDIRFSAGMAIRFRAINLASVTVSGTLAGPGPVVLIGSACIEILFFEICASGELKLGGDNQPPPQAAESPVQTTSQELRAENVHAEGGDNHVRLRPAQRPAGEALVAPNGQLVWSQTKVPLELTLDLVNGQPLAAPQAVRASSPVGQGAADDLFAPGQFLELSDAEALNLPAFQRLQSGLRLGFDERSSSVTRVHTVTTETIRLPQRVPVSLVAVRFPAGILEAVLARGAEPAAQSAPAQVTISQPAYSVYDSAGASIDSGRTAADAFRTAKARGGVAVADGDVVDVGAF